MNEINENSPLCELRFSSRVFSIFNEYKITTISELINKSEMDLLAFRNMGEKSIKEVKEELYDHGLFLREQNENKAKFIRRIEESRKDKNIKEYRREIKFHLDAMQQMLELFNKLCQELNQLL